MANTLLLISKHITNCISSLSLSLFLAYPGEYGPKWHQAALKANRYKCYEDMEAVAQDLIDRKITTPEKMACIGGSNGTFI